MQTQLDAFGEKLEELKTRAGEAQGQAKIDLDLKIADAKVKFDAAGTRLKELRAASADRWEKIKDGVAAAFDDLKQAFE